MKNIETILKDAGVELTEEQLSKIKPAVAENYKTIADYNKQKEKVSDLEQALADTRESLSKFDDVDVDGFKAQIDELKKAISDKDADLKKKDEEYALQMADRDFNDLIEKTITAKSGRNAKAIKALLDMPALKGSKNQQADIEKALDALVEAEDSAMLFGKPEPTNVGTGNPIGTVQKTQTQAPETMASALAEHYKK